ncbi:MAG: hypothetical protein HY830_02305 [Actinobacteria bacterium]|nr:hypothetical protein [Actinomycetota bacterium]
MLDFLIRNWFLILLFGAMAWMHLGHGGHGGHGGQTGRAGGCGGARGGRAKDEHTHPEPRPNRAGEEPTAVYPSEHRVPAADRPQGEQAPAWGTPPSSGASSSSGAPSWPASHDSTHLPDQRRRRGC